MVRLAHTARSIVFSQYGNPREQLALLTHEVPDPKEDQLVLRLLGAPINPADLNQVEGVYPSKPVFDKKNAAGEPVAIGGNEGAFEVIEVGSGDTASKFTKGDWVVPRIASFGTWTTHATVSADDVILLRHAQSRGLKPCQAACISVNPGTAYRMLSDFANLEAGDWFIQNGGTSGVGRMAIQLGRAWGLKSISVVRDRADIDNLKRELTDLGADYVVTEEQISDKSIKHVIKEWTRGSEIKLALNCVGGRSATNIARQLGHDGRIVTYGGMSKQPVALPTSLFIFKNVHSQGFWLTRWNQEYPEKRKAMLEEIVEMVTNNELALSGITQTKLNLEAGDKEFFETFMKAVSSSKKVVLHTK